MTLERLTIELNDDAKARLRPGKDVTVDAFRYLFDFVNEYEPHTISNPHVELQLSYLGEIIHPSPEVAGLSDLYQANNGEAFVWDAEGLHNFKRCNPYRVTAARVNGKCLTLSLEKADNVDWRMMQEELDRFYDTQRSPVLPVVPERVLDRTRKAAHALMRRNIAAKRKSTVRKVAPWIALVAGLTVFGAPYCYDRLFGEETYDGSP